MKHTNGTKHTIDGQQMFKRTYNTGDKVTYNNYTWTVIGYTDTYYHLSSDKGNVAIDFYVLNK